MSTRERPIIAGLTALIAVSLGLALALGLGIWLVLKVAGVDGEAQAAADDSGGGASMVIPKFTEPPPSGGPVLTPGPEKSESAEAAEQPSPITLQTAQTAVAPMQQIDFSGSYAAGEGAVLQVQRFSGGRWVDFNVTASVSGGTYSTYIQTAQTGATRFRMLDTATGQESNEVTVTIG